jgi:hypothetical protein
LNHGGFKLRPQTFNGEKHDGKWMFFIQFREMSHLAYELSQAAQFVTR